MRKRWLVYTVDDGRVWFRCWTRVGAENKAWAMNGPVSGMQVADRYWFAAKREGSDDATQ